MTRPQDNPGPPAREDKHDADAAAGPVDWSSPAAPAVVIHPPSTFRSGALLRINGYGFLLLVPVLISFLVVSVLPFGKVTFLVPAVVMAASLYFLPFGFGNLVVKRLVRRIEPQAGRAVNSYVVQLAFDPRLRQGLRSVLEDADDVGCLWVKEGELVFVGDAVRMTIPAAHIREVHCQNIGWRGLFLYGPRVHVTFSDGHEWRHVQFGERSSLVLPASRRVAHEMTRRVRALVKPA
ncbi:MAG TPA: hypothetical protein PKX23_02030 [Verrucomicrobiota bacterium]|nr:hypothetical protein [Verrucomicrobiota bacterium]HRT08193.1 hypothetical protein [Candidatus Paceibacterota bacterium]HRT56532.1 hypothetical protein [Candidatus Paceibacterota bacterium]